jgi:methyl-accepting chemotaxis protein
MQRTISETSSQAQLVSKAAQVSVDVSKTGQGAVAATVAGMEAVLGRVERIAQSIAALSRRTKQIEEIIAAVEDIVGQSEVLAINATIQAARAGDKGLGFAVVAREMRKLAEQSQLATGNIGGILDEIRDAAGAAVAASEEGREKAREGMGLAGRAGDAIKELSATIEESARVALQIASSTDQQAEAMINLVKAVQSIKDASSQTSTSLKEAGL